MLMSIITLLAGLFTILFLLSTKICNDWYDIWMIFVTFLVCWIISALIVVILVFGCTIFIDKKKVYTKQSKFYRFVIKIVCEFLIQFFRVDVNVRGLEKIPEDKPIFLVQNHTSYIDPIISIWTLRFLNLVFVMKKEVMDMPFISNILYRCDFPALDRENNRKGLETVLSTIKMIKNGEHSVGIFPEGTRSKDGQIHEFRPGSFKIPEKANCPIVVLVCKNTDKILKNFPFKKTQVYFDIVDVLDPEQFKGENTPELSEEIHKMMVNRLEELNKMERGE